MTSSFWKNGIKIKVLGICGSPRKNANTEFLLNQALDAAKSVDREAVETEVYSIAGKEYLPCISCFLCAKTGECVRSKKDDFNELRDKWICADAVIMAVPVYHMSIPGQLKCFIDRLGNSLWSYPGCAGKHLKVYGAIAQGVHIFSGQENTIKEIINHALVMGNIVIAGDPWESYLGGGGWTENKIEKDALKKLYEGKSLDAVVAIKASRSLGKNVAQLALILKAGALLYIDQLKSDPSYTPFVERIIKGKNASHNRKNYQ
jgi:multimeric flavodoxin WrbA